MQIEAILSDILPLILDITHNAFFETYLIAKTKRVLVKSLPFQGNNHRLSMPQLIFR